MSAIAGILWFHGAPPESGLIERVTRTMSRRGPDEQTHWVKGSVALGHCMLRATPESLEEHQPLVSPDGNRVLVWDGRLDNRDELQSSLKAAGIELRDNSDAELTLQCYALWGEDCPEQLLGDFAFAIWDERKQSLFCARDHLGARPFYFVLTDRLFGFASEDEVLLELPGVSRKPNEDLIATCFEPTFNNLDQTRTWLESVCTLMPATSMSIAADGSSRSNAYWQLEPGEISRYASDEECQSAFLEVLGEAVRCRMRTAGDVAAMMSGGMDSAGIAVMVKRYLPDFPYKAFHTYSAMSDHPERCVESQCILKLTQGMGSHAHSVSVPSFAGMASVQDVADVAWKQAHPIDNMILLPSLMCLAAGRDGHRVMLHGACGDLTMYVPDRYPMYLMRDGEWRQAWQECKDASRNNSFLRGSSPVSLFFWNLGRAFMPRWLRPLARRLLRKPVDTRQSAINPEFAKKIRLAERLQAQTIAKSKSGKDNFGQMYAQLVTSPWFGLSQGLSAYERVAGRFGVELRDPWADKRVVEFFINLPIQYRVRHGWTKYLARTALAPYLDEAVCWRIGKEHLGWEITKGLMDTTDSFVSHTLETHLDTLATYMDRDAVKRLYARSRLAREPSVIEYIRDMTALTLWIRRILGQNTNQASHNSRTPN